MCFLRFHGRYSPHRAQIHELNIVETNVMFMRFLPFFAVLSVITISGCAGPDSNIAHPFQPPLNENSGTTAMSSSPPSLTPKPTTPKHPTGVITLRDAIVFALVNSPQLRAFSWDLHTAEANRMQAALLPNPEIEIEVEEFGGTGERSGFDSSTTTIQLGQFIELARKRSKRIHLATLEKRLVEWDYQSKRLDVMNQVTGAFIDALAAQEKLALTQELVRLAKETHNAVALRVNAGKDSPLKETKAKVALSIAQMQSERANQALQSARTQLSATWGAHTPAFQAVTGPFYEVPPVPHPNDLTARISQNPDIARWPAEKQKYFAALDLEKAKATSDLTLSGGLQQLNEGDDTAFILGLSIPIPMFDRNQAGIRRATYAMEKAEEVRKAVEINVHAALSEAARRLSTAFAEATVLTNDVLPGAKSAYDAAGQGYREGKFDYLDVLDAQRTLFEAKGQYVESLAAYHKARADVERLIGQTISAQKNPLSNTHNSN